MLSQELAKELMREFMEDFKNNAGPGSFRHEITQELLSKALMANLAVGLNSADEDLGETFAEKIIIQSNNNDVQEALEKAEEKIGRALDASVDSTSDGDESDDDDEIHGTDSKFPNLKYNKPKYKNLESVLKYVENKKKPGDSGDVRIVIMNFND